MCSNGYLFKADKLSLSNRVTVGFHLLDAGPGRAGVPQVAPGPRLSPRIPILGNSVYAHCFQRVNSIRSPTCFLSSGPVLPLDSLHILQPLHRRPHTDLVAAPGAPPPAAAFPIEVMASPETPAPKPHTPLSITIRGCHVLLTLPPKRLCPLPPPIHTSQAQQLTLSRCPGHLTMPTRSPF